MNEEAEMSIERAAAVTAAIQAAATAGLAYVSAMQYATALHNGHADAPQAYKMVSSTQDLYHDAVDPSALRSG